MGSRASHNRRCPCGSGKKANDCCNGRKPVFETVTVEFSVPTRITGYQVGADGSIAFVCDGTPVSPMRAWVGLHREREKKGEKHLVQVPIESENLRIGELPALKLYNRIFAIDTSTKEIRGNIESICCFAELRITTDGSTQQFNIAQRGIFYFSNTPKNRHENFAWHLLIQMIRASPDYISELQYAIITDSDLGRHGSYNLHTDSYFADHILPANFTLIYASETGQSPTNIAIKQCDKEAKTLLQRLESEQVDLTGAVPIENGWCSQIQGRLYKELDAAQEGWFRFTEMSIGLLASRQWTKTNTWTPCRGQFCPTVLTARPQYGR